MVDYCVTSTVVPDVAACGPLGVSRGLLTMSPVPECNSTSGFPTDMSPHDTNDLELLPLVGVVGRFLEWFELFRTKLLRDADRLSRLVDERFKFDDRLNVADRCKEPD